MSVNIKNRGVFLNGSSPIEAVAPEKEIWSKFLDKLNIPKWFSPESYFLVLPMHLKDFIIDSPKWFVYCHSQDITCISVVKRDLWTKYNKLGE